MKTCEEQVWVMVDNALAVNPCACNFMTKTTYDNATTDF